jgi:hypothetical protein
MSSLQKEDSDIKPIYEAMKQSNEAPDWSSFTCYSEATMNLLAQWPLLTMVKDVIYRRWIDGRTNSTNWLQCIIPEAARDQILKMAHTGMNGGHYGIRKTQQQVQRRSYWKTWRQDCARFIRRCNHCASYRRGKPPKLGDLQDMTVGSPMARAGIDLSGPWPRSDGNTYILSFIDHFTKWAEAVPIPNKEAETVAKALVNNVFTKVGCVLQLLSDQGREFDNLLLTSLCHLLGTDKIRTSPYKASTNACTERLHRSINSMIAKCVDDNQRN